MSESKPCFYETEIEWKGENDLKLTGGKLPVIDAGAPPEFKGREGNWSPEHLFVASLNSCYTLTLLAIAEFSKGPSLVCRRLPAVNWKRSKGAAIKSQRSS